MECPYTTCYYGHVSKQKIAVIVGAGPAGLTATYELLTRTDIKPIVLEQDPQYVGGIARTIQYKGNRMDIGGHRFFSRSDRVTEWWFSILPPQMALDNTEISYHGKTYNVSHSKSADPDRVMLLRPRLSRMHYTKKFFDYPITLSMDTLSKLGLFKLIKIGTTYVYRRVRPIKPEVSLKDFYINRFGDELYKTFFESYTKKLWGMPCEEISPEWGAQRVKGLSITVVIKNALKKFFAPSAHRTHRVETSLIEQFLYPKYGPGQLWETVAEKIAAKGAEVLMGHKVVRINLKGGKVVSVVAQDERGAEREFVCEYVFSTMPISELVGGMHPQAPEHVRDIAVALPYRDFVTVGVLAKKFSPKHGGRIPDTWIYIHEPSVIMCRIQFFNNWSPYLVADPDKQWFGLEYVISTKDKLWSMSDEEVKHFAREELRKLELVEDEDIEDMAVARMEKTYPAYFGSYKDFAVVREYLNTIPNLFPIGRNGMHRYNNQDHSMLAAMVAVDNIVKGRIDKSNLWDINTEQEYHETKSSVS